MSKVEVRDCSFAEYLADPGLNFGTLAQMAKSPAHYRYSSTHSAPDAEHFVVGRALHTMVLEPKEFDRRYFIWKGGRRAGAKWDEFKTLATELSKEILTEKQYLHARALTDAVRQNSLVKTWLNAGRAELSVFWYTNGRRCKARIDWLHREVALDLKTTKDASVGGFGRAAAALQYHLRSAWYADATEAAFGPREQVLVAIEKTPPYDVVPYFVPDHILQAGRQQYMALLDRLSECEDNDEWPGVSTEGRDLWIPDWALMGDGDVELDFTGIEVVGDVKE